MPHVIRIHNIQLLLGLGMTAHAKLGASKAHRWITCPGSIAAEATLPDTSSAAAEEGTAAHALAELCLRNGWAPEKFLGKDVEGTVVDEEMAGAIAVYVDYVNSLRGDKLIEERVSFSAYAPGGFGTADALVFHEGMLEVVDLKYGKGVRVDADQNAQLMLYAVGAFTEHGFDFQVDTVRMTIVQPRLDHIDSFEMRVKDLLFWADKVVRPAAKLALSDNAPFKPSEDACRFCKAKAQCKALAEHNLSVAQLSFDDLGPEPLELPEPHLLNAAQVSDLLPHLDGLVNWASAVKEHAMSVLSAGGIVPGFKLVPGRALRRWGDEQEAEERLGDLLGDEAFVTKLVSPSQAEKLLGRKRAGEISDLITKPQGKPQLAPEADPRPAIGASAFDDLNED